MGYFKKLIKEKSWFQLILAVFVVLPAIPFVVVTLLITIYAFWPTDYDGFETLDRELQTNSNLILIAHGVADSPKNWPTPLADIINTHFDKPRAFAIDWSYQARNAFSCAINGRRLGHFLAQKTMSNSHLKQVHLIGHSCGSHLVYSFCKAIKESGRDVLVRTTFLDPVSVYALDWDYGTRNFGNCADYSEAFIDTEDTIPGSNQSLPHAITYDVTNARLSSNSSTKPHVWPTEFYTTLAANYLEYTQIERELIKPSKLITLNSANDALSNEEHE